MRLRLKFQRSVSIIREEIEIDEDVDNENIESDDDVYPKLNEESKLKESAAPKDQIKGGEVD